MSQIGWAVSRADTSGRGARCNKRRNFQGRQAHRRGKEDRHEDTGPRRGDRRRRGGRQHALPPCQERLAGCRPARAQGADLGLDVARGRPAAAVQHELLGGPDPQVLGALLSGARARDRPGGRLPQGLEHPSGDEPGPHGRVPAVRRRGRNHWRRRALPDPRGGQGGLAAVQRRRAGGRDPAPGRRLRPARRPDPGAGQGRARPRRRDQPQHRRARHRAHAPSARPRASGWSRPTRATSPASTWCRAPATSRAGPAPW